MNRLLTTALAVSMLTLGSGCLRERAAVPSPAPVSASSSGAAVRSVVVDSSALTARSKPGKAAAQYLAGVQNILQKGLDDLVKSYKGKEHTPEAVNAVARAKATLDQELALRQRAVSVEMDRVIREAVRAWRGKNESVLVLPASGLVDYGAGVDVTSAVLPELDKLSLKLPDPPKVSVTKPKKK